MSLPLLAPWFALAGLIAAGGVLVIHLLNRQRYKVVEWAAMDFLREAIFRNRRIMRLRDLLLLLLRMAALALIGLALARPFLGRSAQTVDPNQPVHAVLLIDNSLSMGYEKLDGTLLRDAKARAVELIDKLPRGSRISVAPTCGLPGGFSREAYYNKDDAKEALDLIKPVDRAARARETLDLALEASRRVSDMAAKRIYLLCDRQVATWPVDALAEHLEQFGNTPIEVVEIATQEVENAWISDFQLRDGVADLQTPAVFVATVEYVGEYPRHDVLVTLTVDDVKVAAQTVELQPGQKREVEFPPYQIDVPAEPGRPTFVTAEVSISQDRLPADDQRFLVVPVMATVPVVFVDQWGAEEEQPRRNRYGETFHLRRLLAPLDSRTQPQRQLIEVRHVTADRLEGAVGRDLLADARLVVVAGVDDPQGAAATLKEYVEQGGNLVLAAGGNFDPTAWTQAAFADGLGILPVPLTETTGTLPENATGGLEPFQLDYDSLKNHDYFLLEGVSRQEQEDLYRLPYFFKAVVAQHNDEVADAIVEAVRKELTQRRSVTSQIDQQLADLADRERRGRLSGNEQSRRADLQQQRDRLEPSWLLWSPAESLEDANRPIEELAARTRPVVLARYTDGNPFMVERRQGRGRVLLITTGVYPTWNTLPLTNTMLLYDRILRGMLYDTLPERNLGTQRQFVLPVPAAQRGAQYTLAGPEGQESPLAVEAVGADRWGIPLGELTRRGHYQVVATRTKDSQRLGNGSQAGLDAKLWAVSLAANGPAEESRLLTAEQAGQLIERGQADYSQLARASIAGGLLQPGLRGAGMWRWLMLAVFVLLLLEMTLLTRPSWGGERNA